MIGAAKDVDKAQINCGSGTMPLHAARRRLPLPLQCCKLKGATDRGSFPLFFSLVTDGCVYGVDCWVVVVM